MVLLLVKNSKGKKKIFSFRKCFVYYRGFILLKTGKKVTKREEKKQVFGRIPHCVARLPAFSQSIFFKGQSSRDLTSPSSESFTNVNKTTKYNVCLWSPRHPPLSLQSLGHQGSLAPTLSNQSAPSSVDNFVHSGLLVTGARHNELVIGGDVTAEHRRRLL